MILRCPSCGQKNRLPTNIHRPGIYSCGTCRTTIVDIDLTFHHGFIFGAVDELQRIEGELEEVSLPHFSQKLVDLLQTRAKRAHSRLGLWEHYVSHLLPEERRDVIRSYSPVLMEASEIFFRIEEQIEDKRVYKNFVSFIRQLEAILSPTINILNIILPWFGFTPIKFAPKLLPQQGTLLPP